MVQTEHGWQIELGHVMRGAGEKGKPKVKSQESGNQERQPRGKKDKRTEQPKQLGYTGIREAGDGEAQRWAGEFRIGDRVDISVTGTDLC